MFRDVRSNDAGEGSKALRKAEQPRAIVPKDNICSGGPGTIFVAKSQRSIEAPCERTVLAFMSIERKVIAVVDDDPDMLKGLARLLRVYKFEPHVLTVPSRTRRPA